MGTSEEDKDCCIRHRPSDVDKKEEIIMKRIECSEQKDSMQEIPTVIFHSDVFECPNCHNKEYRRVPPWQNTSSTPCSECGYSPLYRIP